jgi:hypothetical protein
MIIIVESLKKIPDKHNGGRLLEISYADLVALIGELKELADEAADHDGYTVAIVTGAGTMGLHVKAP